MESIAEKADQRQTHKKRMANIEMLRVLAMMMVVSLHFLAKGKLLPTLTGHLGAQGYLAWLLEALSITAVDVYVLISGYFLVETGFRCTRLIRLCLQVLFYTILVPVVLITLGILNPASVTAHQILLDILPVNMLHYWFISAYVLMFLFTPVLNAAVHGMGKVQLKYTILILLLMESVTKTIIPVRLELDNLGYDCIWFMVVYLIAAYIRLYGIRFFSDQKKCRWSYLGLIMLLYGLVMGVRLIYLKTGKFENFISAPFGYNHLVTIAAAIALFYTFYHWKFEGRAADLICRISPYTLGVYLLHEQSDIRYLWQNWLGADRCNTPGMLLFHWAVAILVILAAGIAVDWIRSGIFDLAGKILAKSQLNLWLKQIDRKINGKME